MLLLTSGQQKSQVFGELLHFIVENEVENPSSLRLETWLQASKLPKFVGGVTPELRRTSSFDRTWEENVAESVANELVLQSLSSGKSGPLGSVEQHDESSRKKDSRPKSGRLSHEEKKVGKSSEDKRSRPRKLMEFHNIKISQVRHIC